MIWKQETSTDSRSQNATALDALQEARARSPGVQRTDALKKAGLLRRIADGTDQNFRKAGLESDLR
jgi:hypothetical protein